MSNVHRSPIWSIARASANHASHISVFNDAPGQSSVSPFEG
jgi:hypothetical protein